MSGHLWGQSSQYPVLIILTFLTYLPCLLYSRSKLNSPALAVHRAIKTNQMVPYYQPVYELTTDRYIGAELLVRWEHPLQGIISPNEFIYTVEQHGLVTDMTLALMKKALHDMTALHQRIKMEFDLAINIASVSLSSDKFVQSCADFAGKLNELNCSLTIELTERQKIIISDEVIAKLGSCNIKISLDDFGTGNSNYALVEKVQPAFIKVDKMFVDAINSGGINENILKSIVLFSEDINTPNIAEGIETEEQHNVLKAMNVRYAQGYYYGKPMPFVELLNFLKTHMV